MVLRYGYLMVPGVFRDVDVTPDIDFTVNAVVSSIFVTILLQVLVIHKLSQINFDMNTYVLFLDPVMWIVLIY